MPCRYGLWIIEHVYKRIIIPQTKQSGGKTMINGENFSIQFPILLEVNGGPSTAATCDNNTNYFTSGGQRSTCCCDCDK
jgi:hypothetical protein